MRMRRKGVAGAIVAMLLLLLAACGDSGGGSKSSDTTKPANKGSITIGSANFSENVLLANLYAKALGDAGYRTTVRANLGAREIIFPALEKGEIDLIPEYSGNALNFVATDQVKAGDDVKAQTQKLADAVKAKQLSVLEPSDASDGDVIVVTKATADKDHLSKISDLANVSGSLTLGGPSECETRSTCFKGLQDTYALKNLKFKSLDAGGPITRSALEKGEIDVARLFSADPAIKEKGFVILDDDKHIQLTGNIVPVIRTDKVTADVTKILNKVSSTLTTDDLIAMNTKIDVDKQDPDQVAQDYLVSKGLIKKS
jgi:osmoprotectant transport system substrate-binding protein